ncbi:MULTISPECIES: hypothetical protein [Bacillus]|uniref:Uncharacterized protein n=1 Tax=Bacillus glycinifermentans TaxID=1664069 RepID=A0AAJ3YYG2_9BACI|nr:MULTISPECIES: hypothetical protein [Bacillus]KKB71701.1 hypothetical protein TH62_21235 [Bacillus sp. TH008]MBU8785223.1 hypothetical protein [Bacillus glycinifermentans]MDU0069686.1 hypothetical protein [Bacillus sp. IG6]MED8017973.1 hypothetical protein [Bacillus glycinifermentans]NUJ15393.1 hypothetical protein [Bacillus glycinifermentans]
MPQKQQVRQGEGTIRTPLDVLEADIVNQLKLKWQGWKPAAVFPSFFINQFQLAEEISSSTANL